jgi:hypothetical protein
MHPPNSRDDKASHLWQAQGFTIVERIFGKLLVMETSFFDLQDYYPNFLLVSDIYLEIF